ncbi:thioredoxin protein (macronuclear) [Tetrahymena thermophila SB210]|uniref:Thioredoxin protein n=1 Tax=Tetrahymena thermophila (strain SB210) TaxID=312017 RepID=Q24DM1_TETTS|nr:thioredoxin protein [Tetrahymena thermophila SB210]EAS05892.2 thioredoxin protein [Tetrahymena thermophila SB210]|eukprot:XP_001026137.2 thioredoxin protein [Tetrahymena thermophila SB210]
MRSAFIILALLAASAFCTQNVPIPNTYDGFVIGDPNAPVTVEAFYDLLCPASEAANEQINLLFTNATFAQYLPKIKFIYHIFPLPYHDYAFSFAQLYRHVFDNHDAKTTFDFINWSFDIQEQYWNGPVTNYTRNAVFNKLAHQLHDFVPKISINETLAALTNRTYDLEARYSWKYGVSREVAGTPYFFLNGVQLDGAESFSSSTWAETLLPYIQADSNGKPKSVNQFKDFFNSTQY